VLQLLEQSGVVEVVDVLRQLELLLQVGVAGFGVLENILQATIDSFE